MHTLHVAGKAAKKQTSQKARGPYHSVLGHYIATHQQTLGRDAQYNYAYTGQYN